MFDYNIYNLLAWVADKKIELENWWVETCPREWKYVSPYCPDLPPEPEPEPELPKTNWEMAQAYLEDTINSVSETTGLSPTQMGATIAGVSLAAVLAIKLKTLLQSKPVVTENTMSHDTPNNNEIPATLNVENAVDTTTSVISQTHEEKTAIDPTVLKNLVQRYIAKNPNEEVAIQLFGSMRLRDAQSQRYSNPDIKEAINQHVLTKLGLPEDGMLTAADIARIEEIKIKLSTSSNNTQNSSMANGSMPTAVTNEFLEKMKQRRSGLLGR